MSLPSPPQAVPSRRRGLGAAGGASRELQTIATHKYECARGVTMPEGRVNI